MSITKLGDISLALAVWLVHDDYDYINEPNYISATSLMKPIRHVVLPGRIPMEKRTPPDVEDFISRALGHSVHDSVEKAWKKGYKKNLAKLGYPESVINTVLINPTEEQLLIAPDCIPVYLEQRAIREFRGFKIGGKFDIVADGIVQDYKTTSSYTWLYGTRDDEHALQGSLYKWLNPTKITENFIRINYAFTDWQRMSAKSNPAYPQRRVLHKDIPLWSTEKTEEWISNKLDEIMKWKQEPDEKLIPECTDEELWRSDPQFKYYSDPNKTDGRATRRFDTLFDARAFMAEKGGKGVVKTIPGVPKRCDYCEAFEACSQKDRYQHD